MNWTDFIAWLNNRLNHICFFIFFGSSSFFCVSIILKAGHYISPCFEFSISFDCVGGIKLIKMNKWLYEIKWRQKKRERKHAELNWRTFWMLCRRYIRCAYQFGCRDETEHRKMEQNTSATIVMLSGYLSGHWLNEGIDISSYISCVCECAFPHRVKALFYQYKCAEMSCSHLGARTKPIPKCDDMFIRLRFCFYLLGFGVRFTRCEWISVTSFWIYTFNFGCMIGVYSVRKKKAINSEWNSVDCVRKTKSWKSESGKDITRSIIQTEFNKCTRFIQLCVDLSLASVLLLFFMIRFLFQ